MDAKQILDSIPEKDWDVTVWLPGPGALSTNGRLDNANRKAIIKKVLEIINTEKLQNDKALSSHAATIDVEFYIKVKMKDIAVVYNQDDIDEPSEARIEKKMKKIIDLLCNYGDEDLTEIEFELDSSDGASFNIIKVRTD